MTNRQEENRNNGKADDDTDGGAKGTPPPIQTRHGDTGEPFQQRRFRNPLPEGTMEHFMCGFAATDGEGTEWELANPTWLKRFIPITGHPAMRFLPKAAADDINRQLARQENHSCPTSPDVL